MGPIEIVFLVIIAMFGAIGVVRGLNRELGVTLMLLVGLLVLELLEDQYGRQLNIALATMAGPNPQEQAIARMAIFCGFLTIVAFISYQGITLSFAGASQNNVFGLGTGLLNGYLYAGSLWYYLDWAGWPFLNIQQPFTDFYHFAVALLPPAVFKWQYLIALVAFMLIVRVWK